MVERLRKRQAMCSVRCGRCVKYSVDMDARAALQGRTVQVGNRR